MAKYVLLLLFVMFSVSSTSLVTWVPSSNFNLPLNFVDKKLPCSKQMVVFPETVENAIVLSTKTSVKGFILPMDGEIILDMSEIEFGADTNDSTCSDGNAYFMNKAASSWSDPDVWQSERFNEATPDAERIPCYDDMVEFPEKAQFSITLPDATQEIKGMIVKGHSITYIGFIGLIFDTTSDNTQTFTFNKNNLVGLKFGKSDFETPCNSLAGCPCQKLALEINCAIKVCQKPACLEPIKPKGHCCKICGGALAFNVEDTFNLMEFKELVERTVDSYGAYRVAYHIGRLMNNEVQLVVVDKGDYEGTSAMVVNDISHFMDKDWVKGEQISLLSGSPLSKKGLGGKIAVSMFCIVVLVMAAIYFYYYKLPKVQFPMLIRDHRTALSRYQRRTDSVATLTRGDSNVSLPNATAFRNPLYDSKRGRVDVVETSVIDDE